MKNNNHEHLKNLTRGIFVENPLFVMILGTCPALAVTKSLEAALGMSILFMITLIGSNVVISLLKKLIPEAIKIPCYIVIIASFVTVIKMLCEAFLPELYSTLGVFLSLLVVNCIVLGRAEAFANKNTVFDSLLDGIGNGIGYTLAISVIGLIREILGTGMLTFGEVFTFLPLVHLPILASADGSFDYSLSLFSQPTGGFIVFGILMALIAFHDNRKKDKAAEARRAAAFAAANPAPSAPVSADGKGG